MCTCNAAVDVKQMFIKHIHVKLNVPVKQIVALSTCSRRLHVFFKHVFMFKYIFTLSTFEP